MRESLIGQHPLPAAGRGRSLQRALCIARGQGGESARQHHGIDNLDDTVGLHYVTDGDFGGVALGVDDPKLAVLFLDCQRATLHRIQLRLAAACHDALTQVLGGEAAWHDVIGQYISQCLFVLGLEQRRHCAVRQLGERLVGRREP